MNPLKKGRWRIHTVQVNSSPTGDNDGFLTLVSTDDEIRIEPADIAFSVQQSTARSAVLESRSQIFFADFSIRGDQLSLNLSRPSFSETISMTATLESDLVPTV